MRSAVPWPAPASLARYVRASEVGQKPDRAGPSVGVATRNDERSDAQSRVVFGARSVRISVTIGARYLRLSARSLRRTRDHRVRRTLIETERPNGDWL